MNARVADLLAEIKRLSEAATVYMLAMGAMEDEKVTAVEMFVIDGTRYIMRLYLPTSTHGGIVTTTQKHKGQRTMVTAGYLDQMAATFRPEKTSPTMQPFCVAVERLTAARNRANEIPR